jgi:hypothetical protein
VICPLGDGWEKERNSVVLILNRGSSSFCSGALINNAANLDIPYVLTARHCFVSNDGNNDPTQWKFTFQAWSPTCNPTQNAEGITFNGATLKAVSQPTDFCLVQMNTSPPPSTCITAAGWSRVTSGITQVTSLHHPVGDVMKIARDNQAPVQEVSNVSGLGGNVSCWRIELDQGLLQRGSSGAPYFDQNHRIIAQHAFGLNGNAPPLCDRLVKSGGRFDLSWTGGGTSSTRLSDWLDPYNTGAMTADARVSGLSISVPSLICSYSTQLQSTGGVSWLSSNPSILSIDPTTGMAIRPSNLNGFVTVSGTSSGCGSSYPPLTTTTFVGPPTADNSTLIYPSGQRGVDPVTLCAGCAYNFQVDQVHGASSYTWILPAGFSFVSDRNTATPGIRMSTQSGTYTLFCSANNACNPSYTRSLTIIIGGGGGQQQRVAAYPNPTANSLTIEYTGNSLSVVDANPSDTGKKGVEFSAQILNEFNQTLLSSESKNGKIVFYVSGLQNGVYYLHVIRNGELSSQQILVSR